MQQVNCYILHYHNRQNYEFLISFTIISIRNHLASIKRQLQQAGSPARPTKSVGYEKKEKGQIFGYEDLSSVAPHLGLEPRTP